MNESDRFGNFMVPGTPSGSWSQDHRHAGAHPSLRPRNTNPVAFSQARLQRTAAARVAREDFSRASYFSRPTNAGALNSQYELLSGVRDNSALEMISNFGFVLSGGATYN